MREAANAAAALCKYPPKWLDGRLASYEVPEVWAVRFVYTDLVGRYTFDYKPHCEPTDIGDWLWTVSGPVRLWGSGLWTEMAW